MRLLFFVWSTKGERFVHFFIVSFVIIENRLLKNVELQFLMRIFVLKKKFFEDVFWLFDFLQ